MNNTRATRSRIKVLLQYAFYAYNKPNTKVKDRIYGMYTSTEKAEMVATTKVSNLLTRDFLPVEENLSTSQVLNYNYDRRRFKQYCYDLVNHKATDRTVDEIILEIEHEGLPKKMFSSQTNPLTLQERIDLIRAEKKSQK